MNYFYRLFELVFNFPSLIISEVLSLLGFKASVALDYGWYIQNLVYLIIFIFFIYKRLSPSKNH